MMKTLLIFFFALFLTVDSFETIPFKEVTELTSDKIDAFFGNFTTNIEEFLKTQDSSISSPIKDVINCINGNEAEALNKLAIELLSAFTDGKELSERKDGFCKAEIVEDVSICFDHVATETNHLALNTLKTAVFLPLHEVCTYENPNEHLNFIQNLKSSIFTKKERQALARFDEIVSGKTTATEGDSCLPFAISAAYSEIIDTSEDVSFNALSRGMFVDAIQLYYSMKAELAFKTINDCGEIFEQF